MSKKLIAFLFIAAIFGTITLGHFDGALARSPVSATLVEMPLATPPANVNSEMDSDALASPELGASAKPYEGSRAIIEDDDRIEVTSRKYPWSAIGRLDWLSASGQVVGHCTGTLIGKDLVLTNSHCVVDTDTHQLVPYQIRFRPNLILDYSPDEAFVEEVKFGTNFSSGQIADPNDWALLKLDKPLGDKYGYFGWISPEFSVIQSLEEKLALAGYSGDFPQKFPGETASVHIGCSILGESPDGLLEHNCDTTGGASGGPIFARFSLTESGYYIVGLHAGTLDGETLNYGVKVSAWAPTAKAMRE